MHKSRVWKQQRHQTRVCKHRAKARARRKDWLKEKHIRQNRPGGYVSRFPMPMALPMFDLFGMAIGRRR